MKTLQKISAIIVLLFSVNAAVAQYQVPISVVTQEQNQWCWDANSKCILKYYGFNVSQCSIAEYCRSVNPSYFGNSACCSNPSGKCNSPNYLDGESGVKGVLKHFGNLESNPVERVISVTEINDEMTGKRPYIILVTWSSGGGHVMVACNYTGTSLTFMDPWQGNGFTTCKHTATGTLISTKSGDGTWAETLTILPSSTTGINNVVSTDNMLIYPNPSAGELTVNTSFNIKTINVYNVTGQLVESFIPGGVNSYALKINTPGLYNMQVIATDGRTSNQKVVIQ
ncbi:MAG TPA: T9SS type A sorting domain-containing protein [Bacteroidia bacterium]|jgi:hypothetical protein|nr:T9SS type A sorting domain-containing protein [Bacteroidia bacterium]